MQDILQNNDNDTLPIVECFYSLQGEGYNTGIAAFFIRLAGCDVGCSWCDSKNSWNIQQYPLLSIDEIVSSVIECGAKNVVITGGEPLLHSLDNLCSELRKNDVKIFLETSGSSPFSGEFDWICLSPKHNKAPLPEIFQMASELKMVIVDALQDFKWAEECRTFVKKECKLYLQPEWNNRNMVLPDIIEYIKRSPQWILSYQSHKYINIP